MTISRDYFYGGERLGFEFLPIVHEPLDRKVGLELQARKSRAMSLRTPMPALYSTMTILIE